MEVPEILPDEFEREIVLSFGLEPEGVDILIFTHGLEFRSAYENSIEETFSGLKIRIIHIRDLIRNKEQLQRKGEKSFLDKYDVEVLKKILKKKKKSSRVANLRPYEKIDYQLHCRIRRKQYS